MRALVWHGDDRLELESLPEPVAGEGEVLLEVELAGICGSDLHAYRGHPGPRRPPLVLGHEAVGSVPGRSGRFVVFPLVVCGSCAACRRGEENLCERRGLLGLDRQGVFAERVPVRADALVPVPEGLDPLVAVLVEPLATSLSALRVDGVQAGRFRSRRRRRPDRAPRRLRSGCARSPGHLRRAGGRAARPRRAPRRHGRPDRRRADAPPGEADLAVDAVGIERTWRAAVAGVRTGGVVALVGLGQAEGPMPVGDLVRRGVTVRGHYAYTRRDFEDALALLAASQPPVDWVTVLGLSEGAEGFRLLVEEPSAATKILLTPP